MKNIKHNIDCASREDPDKILEECNSKNEQQHVLIGEYCTQIEHNSLLQCNVELEWVIKERDVFQQCEEINALLKETEQKAELEAMKMIEN